jgi:hypothetical protein
MFNLKELKEVKVKEQYRVEISNRFAALEELDTEMDINRAWETIRGSTKISAKESLGYQNYNSACRSVWVRNLVFNIKGGT